ncbi:MAG: D-alanyl-D-alanine carboxypeptidase family protein [Actinobacteria bacterium]|nr:D-alanyl-D-alanine carboxypeptidase family protein [Actinomycetota bacterium]
MRGLGVVFCLTLLALPAQAAEEEYPTYTGEQYVALYDHAVGNLLPGLGAPNGRHSITGDAVVDERIYAQALERGYVFRPAATGELVSVGGVPMQPQAAEAWLALRDLARSAGLGFTVSSAYRSPESQRAQFLSKLTGTSPEAIDAALTWYSAPGMSKHHGGYALDFRYADGTFGEFRSTPAFAWLSADDFAIPTAYGLIPSYPDDVSDQGPNPEPWEFVWVGEGLIRCGLPQDLDVAASGPAAGLLADIERCPGGPGTANVPDWLAGS